MYGYDGTIIAHSLDMFEPRLCSIYEVTNCVLCLAPPITFFSFSFPLCEKKEKKKDVEGAKKDIETDKRIKKNISLYIKLKKYFSFKSFQWA